MHQCRPFPNHPRIFRDLGHLVPEADASAVAMFSPSPASAPAGGCCGHRCVASARYFSCAGGSAPEHRTVSLLYCAHEWIY